MLAPRTQIPNHLLASRLQAAVLIHCSRDKSITVLNRAKQKARVCDGHAVVKQESDRLPAGKTAIADQLS